jgi:hypothetical protein
LAIVSFFYLPSLFLLTSHSPRRFKHVLGDFVELKSVIKAQYPTINIVGAAENTRIHNYPKTAPDHGLV